MWLKKRAAPGRGGAGKLVEIKLPNELLKRVPVLVPQQIPEEFYMDLGVQAR